MPDIYLTGASGWLGLNLVELLSSSNAKDFSLDVASVTALLAPHEGSSALEAINPDIHLESGDVRDTAALGRFFQGARGGILVHTAGIIHPRRVREFYEINRDGTRNVLEKARAAGVKRAVVVSSNSPCGCNPHPDHLFDESSAYRPYMNYGRSKMEMETIVRQFQEEGDMETVIIRAPWFYGPHQPARQALFFEMIRAGKVPVVGSGDNLRSMAYTGNLAQGIALAAAHPAAAGQTYWIADERPYSMNEIIDTIERMLEDEFGRTCAHRRVSLPGFLSEIAYCADALIQGTGFYHQKIHVLSEMNKTIACSVRKAQDELGYRPEISLEEGMRRSLAAIYGTPIAETVLA